MASVRQPDHASSSGRGSDGIGGGISQPDIITIMVNKFIVSEYSSTPPSESGRVKIAGRPLYDLARVQAIVEDKNRLFTWTEKCRKDVFKLLDDDLGEVAGLIQCLKASDYIDSEWCENGKDAMAACDAHSIRRMEVIPATNKAMLVGYFLKFAIGNGRQLSVAGVLPCLKGMS